MLDTFCIELASSRQFVLITRFTGSSMGDKIKDKVGGMFGKDSSSRQDDY